MDPQLKRDEDDISSKKSSGRGWFHSERERGRVFSWGGAGGKNYGIYLNGMSSLRYSTTDDNNLVPPTAKIQLSSLTIHCNKCMQNSGMKGTLQERNRTYINFKTIFTDQCDRNFFKKSMSKVIFQPTADECLDRNQVV